MSHSIGGSNPFVPPDPEKIQKKRSSNSGDDKGPSSVKALRAKLEAGQKEKVDKHVTGSHQKGSTKASALVKRELPPPPAIFRGAGNLSTKNLPLPPPEAGGPPTDLPPSLPPTSKKPPQDETQIESKKTFQENRDKLFATQLQNEEKNAGKGIPVDEEQLKTDEAFAYDLQGQELFMHHVNNASTRSDEALARRLQDEEEKSSPPPKEAISQAPARGRRPQMPLPKAVAFDNHILKNANSEGLKYDPASMLFVNEDRTVARTKDDLDYHPDPVLTMKRDYQYNKDTNSFFHKTTYAEISFDEFTKLPS